MATVFYDDPSYNYQRYWQQRAYEDEAERIVLRRIFDLIPTKESLLDIGGGFGRLVPEYGPLFRQCILIDPSHELLDDARKLYQKYKNLSVKRGWVENLPLKTKSVDVAMLIRTLHHLAQPKIAVKEIHRVLKPGGYLILEFANKIHVKNLLRALIGLDFKFFTKHAPKDISHDEGGVPFFNYHPNQIKTLLLSEGFEISKTFSVSNFRHPLIKKIVPDKILLFLENLLQEPLASINFGPSIFVLAQKSPRT